MRMSILWAALTFMLVAALGDQATACRWQGGPYRYSTGDLASSSATIVVRLPADAKLFFDDSPTTSTGPSRLFTTPPLNPGGEFNYSVRAEANRDGQTVEMTKQVTVRASSTTQVDFGDMKSGSNPKIPGDPELGAPAKAVRDVPAVPRNPLEPAVGTKFDNVEKIERPSPK